MQPSIDGVLGPKVLIARVVCTDTLRQLKALLGYCYATSRLRLTPATPCVCVCMSQAGQGPDVWWQLKRLFRVEKAGTQQHRKRKGGKKQDGGAGSRR